MSESLESFFAPGPDAAPQPAPAAEQAPEEPGLDAGEAALIAEACTKSGLVWLRPLTEQRFTAAWHVWHEDAVHVVYGVDEQMLPPLAGDVEVAVPSKETGTRLVTFLAVGEPLTPGTARWDAAADALSAARLNARDPADQRRRWASGTVLVRLAPLYVVASGAGGDATPSGAAPPPGNPGTTLGDQPWHLRGRRRRRR